MSSLSRPRWRPVSVTRLMNSLPVMSIGSDNFVRLIKLRQRFFPRLTNVSPACLFTWEEHGWPAAFPPCRGCNIQQETRYGADLPRLRLQLNCTTWTLTVAEHVGKHESTAWGEILQNGKALIVIVIATPLGARSRT